MHLIQSLKNEFCFDLPMFSKYPATSINSYFFKMTLLAFSKIRLHNLTISLKPKSYISSSQKWSWPDEAELFFCCLKMVEGFQADNLPHQNLSGVKCQNTLRTGQKNHFRRWLKYDGTKNAQLILIIINH